MSIKVEQIVAKEKSSFLGRQAAVNSAEADIAGFNWELNRFKME
ncbi:hypothetical protein DSM25559_5117 [Agrobacterium rosae]|jgi:hypothetical protein|uniref:Uncharacterized protein n=1 Tax=Agrobacterium rosae TaxID=1972867 RepID=A0A1R3U966_9HYPH|nr:hypothetical protein DSM25559_5117 [Agrobacterium rosae]